MKRLPIAQNTQDWLDFKWGKLSGSSAKSARPLQRGKDRTAPGVWSVLAGMVALPPSGEKAMERGHRIEDEALEYYEKTHNVKINKDAGVWVSDLDERMMFSPDGDDGKDEPEQSYEVKALGSEKHLKIIFKDLYAREMDGTDYLGFNSLPNDAGAYYRDQAIDAFVVNDKLKRHTVIFYDDRVAREELVMHTIDITREQVQDEVDLLLQQQRDTIEAARKALAYIYRRKGIK